MKRDRVLSLLFCLLTVALLLGCASTPTTRSTGEFIDDSVVSTKVKTALLKESSLKAFQIEVQTFKGNVQLSGFVDTATEVKRAGSVARGVEGVKSVRNNLVVK